MLKKVVVLVRQEGLGQTAASDRQFGIDMLDRFFHTLEGLPIKPPETSSGSVPDVDQRRN